MDETGGKNRLSIFKYNAILSALLFISSSFYLGVGLKNFSFSKYTISQMSYFLDNGQLSFFNFLFFIKCLLDLSFTFYVFREFKTKLNIVTKIIWLLAVLSFGLIGFFPENKFYLIHWSVAACIFLFWTISEHFMAKITGSNRFVYFSNNLIFIQFTLIFLAFSLNWVNAIFETVYFLLVFLWLLIFIGVYMK